MANENDPLFSIDSNDILAKLHLAAQEQVQKNVVVLNTAIVNPIDKADPQNIGTTKFDLSNKSGEYQFAAVRTDFSFYPEIDLSLKPEITDADKEIKKQKPNYDKAKEAFEKAKADYEKLGGSIDDLKSDADKEKDKKDSNTSLTDKNADKDTESDPKKDQAKKALVKAMSEFNKVKKPYVETQNKFIKAFLGNKGIPSWIDKQAQAAVNDVEKVHDKELKLDKDQLESLSPQDIQIYNLAYALKVENEARKKQFNDNIKTWTNTTYKEYIMKYFETFCGKESASKIRESDIVPVFFSVDLVKSATELSKQFIKDYKLVPMEKSEFMKEAQKEAMTNNKKWQIKPTVGFAVGYSVEVETM